jgi:hypothetical protein
MADLAEQVGADVQEVARGIGLRKVAGRRLDMKKPSSASQLEQAAEQGCAKSRKNAALRGRLRLCSTFFYAVPCTGGRTA